MNVLAVTILVSSCLAAIFVVCFAIESRRARRTSLEHDSLIPFRPAFAETSQTMTSQITCDDKTVRRFMSASIIWGIVGMIVGVLAATQLSWWQMNGKFLEAISFGLFKGEGWYGHNAVAFFLTTPILGIMYYFIPKAAERPVSSYRLSIIHFWALVFIYIWAGPHHLLNTAKA